MKRGGLASHMPVPGSFCVCLSSVRTSALAILCEPRKKRALPLAPCCVTFGRRPLRGAGGALTGSLLSLAPPLVEMLGSCIPALMAVCNTERPGGGRDGSYEMGLPRDVTRCQDA